MKTLFDIIFSALAIILLSPILFLVFILIFLLERETPIFVQMRLGKNKKYFKIYKIRTMKNNKITFLGRIFRKTGIDELPQLINILKLEMSLVGPRPLTLDDIKRLNWDKDYYNQRWNTRPGIVGLAQLSPVCHKKMSWFYDKYYILNRNFLLDLKIIALSTLIPLFGKKMVISWIHKKKK